MQTKKILSIIITVLLSYSFVFSKTRVNFEIALSGFLEDTEIKSVYLAGDFNDWLENEAGKITVKVPEKYILNYKPEKKIWGIDLKLKAGRYEYKFVVNDEWWFSDPENSPFLNEYGNSVLFAGEKEKEEEKREIKFEYENPEAKTVYLAGSFNYWANLAVNIITGKTILFPEYKFRSEGGNIFNKAIKLPKGKYEYKFIVTLADDKIIWVLDPKNELKSGTPDKPEEQNSVLIVE